jgi:hypothetical protein
MRIFITAVILISMFMIFPQKRAESADKVIFTDMVTSINRNELHMSGLRFFVSPKLEVFLKTDNGKTVSKKSLFAVGRIDRASVYVKGSQVYKIVVLDMRM